MATTTNGRLVSPKQPNERLDYDFDWTARLSPSEDTIVSGNVFCEDVTISVDETEISPMVVKQWLTGGVVGQVYKLTCHILTAKGRELEAEMWVKVKEL
jgi:hypothetical protein